MGSLSQLAGKLLGFFSRHPAIKSSLQAGTLMCGGDLISQIVVEKRKKIDFTRTARFGLIGFGVIGPVLFRWYGFLETRIILQTPALTALGKMAADQLTFAPLFLFTFFWMNGGLQGLSPTEIKKNIARDYTDVLIANYKLWPAVQIINFWFIPLSQRVLFVQTVALFWNTYLAWKTNQTDISESMQLN